MSRSKLKIAAPFAAWGPDVQEGTLSRPDGRELQVLLRVVQKKADASELKAIQEQVRDLNRVRNEGMLRLHHVTAFGERAALVYSYVDGVSIGRILDIQRARGSLLPIRVALCLARSTAEILAFAEKDVGRKLPGRQLSHQGPTPNDVLVLPSGSLKIAGLIVHPEGASPQPPLPGYAPPEGPGSRKALSYGLGAMLIELLTGGRPSVSDSDPAVHDAVVDTALASVRARPGEKTPNGVLVLLQAALSRDPVTRPSTSSFARQLTVLVESLRGPELPSWASVTVPAAQARLKDSNIPSRSSRAPSLQPIPQRPDATDGIPTSIRSPELADRARRQALEMDKQRRAPPRPPRGLTPNLASGPPPVRRVAPPTGEPTQAMANPIHQRQLDPTQEVEIPAFLQAPTGEPTEEMRLPEYEGDDPTVLLREPVTEEDETVMVGRAEVEASMGGFLMEETGEQEPALGLNAPSGPSLGLGGGAPLAGGPQGGGGPELGLDRSLGGLGGPALDGPGLGGPPVPVEIEEEEEDGRGGLFYVGATTVAVMSLLLMAVAWYGLSRTDTPIAEEVLGAPALDGLELDEFVDEELVEEPVEQPTDASEPVDTPPAAPGPPAAKPAADQPPAEKPPAASTSSATPVAKPAAAKPAAPEPEAFEDDEVVGRLAPKTEAPKTEAPKTEAPKTEAPVEDDAIVGRLAPAPSAPAETTEPTEMPSTPNEERIVVITGPDGTRVTTAESADAPPADTFSAVFMLAKDQGLSDMKVKCGQGTTSGMGPVVVRQTVKGTCRVQATGPAGPLTTFFELPGPGDYVCFDGGDGGCR